jgi:multidrug efflux system outer membrane protein
LPCTEHAPARSLVLRRSPAWAALLALLTLTGCALGPDYQGPPESAAQQLDGPLLRAAAAGVPVASQPLPSSWWLDLHDSLLSQLIADALRDNFQLQAAQAKLGASRALLAQRRAERMPAFGLSAGYSRISPSHDLERSVAALQRNTVSGAAAAAAGAAAPDDDLASNLYNLGLDASWEVDVFGRRSRAAERAEARAQSDAAALADVQVQLAAEVAQVYTSLIADRQRLRLAQDNLDKVQNMLELTRQRRARGVASELELERLELQRRQQEADLPALRAQAAVAQDQLALLTGRAAGSLDLQLEAAQQLPQLPALVVVDDARALLRRRPDIRQAERELAASNAQIGEAMAGYFPQLRLLGMIGLGASSPAELSSDAASLLISPMLSWSLLDFGRVSARVDQARASHQGQLAQYQATVLAALQDANAALTRFGAARSQLRSAEQARQAAERSAGLMQQRHAAGAATLIDLLDVQRQRLSASDAALQAQAQLLLRYVALQKSLGLGWQAPAQGLPAAS